MYQAVTNNDIGAQVY